MHKTLTKLEHPERSRTYHYADGTRHAFADIAGVGVTKSGYHKLESANKEKHIVAPGWRFVTLDTDEWTF